MPVIIPRETFDAVQRRLAENKRWADRNTQHEYLLSGLMKHSCGSGMGGRTSKGKPHYYCFKSHAFKAPINGKGEPQPCTWCNWSEACLRGDSGLRGRLVGWMERDDEARRDGAERTETDRALAELWRIGEKEDE